MPGASLTRTVTFHALHRYYRPAWSEAKNQEVFGSLSDAPGHGHEYRCGVTIGGSVDRGTGMIMDLGVLDQIIQEEVLTPLRGKHINLDIPEFGYGHTLPTCEALAAYVYRRIAPRLPPDVSLERVRIAEDPTLYADCTRLA
jgi:6-pyruvoyltetrahydropterin/6-carboxytetrahydropterin synthase